MNEIRYCAGIVTLAPNTTPESFAGGGAAEELWDHAEHDLKLIIARERSRYATVELVDEPFRRGPLPGHDEEGNHIADSFQVVQRIRVTA